jgi:hypothetical protein
MWIIDLENLACSIKTYYFVITKVTKNLRIILYFTLAWNMWNVNEKVLTKKLEIGYIFVLCV